MNAMLSTQLMFSMFLGKFMDIYILVALYIFFSLFPLFCYVGDTKFVWVKNVVFHFFLLYNPYLFRKLRTRKMPLNSQKLLSLESEFNRASQRLMF